MENVNFIFPHQLFEYHPLLQNGFPIYLIEEHLFFNQYAFHKQKIAFHRASMKAYAAFLENQGLSINYVEANDLNADIRKLIQTLSSKNTKTIHLVDPTDNWLQKRIKKSAAKAKINVASYENPSFLNTKKELEGFFRKDKKKFFQTKFYIEQRKKRNILIEKEDQPVGGKWSFDTENRKKYPKGKTPPEISFPKPDILRRSNKSMLKNTSQIIREFYQTHLILPYRLQNDKRLVQRFFKATICRIWAL